MGVAQDVTLTLARLRRGLVASGADDLFRGKAGIGHFRREADIKRLAGPAA